MKKLLPTKYYDKKEDIPVEAYYNAGYRGILFDIDNTLVPHDEPVDDKARIFVEKLKALGFGICLISNNDEERVKTFADPLGVSYVYKAWKPKREGYIFDGWYTERNGGTLVTSLTSPSADVKTLYAHWRSADSYSPTSSVSDVSTNMLSYYVAFNPNGGNGNMAMQTFRYGEVDHLISNPFVKAGYDFEGWGLTATGAVAYVDGQTVSNLTTAANGVVELFALWREPSYSVAFNANGGTGNMATQTFRYGEADMLSSNSFTREGYDFEGWGLSATGAVAYVDGQTVSKIGRAHV